ncbi:uncharacterized protein LOC124912331 [Impatiens glandulifera]|uniref:uncharacterized protein LOC124912331 n=1 Tax=Impatiens glandulifera TaxID=253017 RepID=UPI001FB0D54E|nr:uncharacterized protein LOC124912331 [Impatiens glandulifera]
MAGDRKRIIKLFFPSVPHNIVPFVVWEEQRLDLGSIARLFDLQPSTLKLNGHFISRGIDFIASSVTWKSLLSFFSSRGFSTGSSDADALLVDGKRLIIGTKRSHYPPTEDNEAAWLSSNVEGENLFKKKRVVVSQNSGYNEHQSGIICNSGEIGEKRKWQYEDTTAYKRTKTNGTGSSPGYNDHQSDKISDSGEIGEKRKWQFEDTTVYKRTKTTGTGSSPGEGSFSRTNSNSQSRCGFFDRGMKRPRELEVNISSPCSKRSKFIDLSLG